ncbi:Protein winged eye [Halotydeus destructor]|nr:Protein winged eye [Halotydeus destructor]
MDSSAATNGQLDGDRYAVPHRCPLSTDVTSNGPPLSAHLGPAWTTRSPFCCSPFTMNSSGSINAGLGPPPAHRPVVSLPSPLVSPASPCLPPTHSDLFLGPSPYHHSPSSLSSSLYHSSRLALYGPQAFSASPAQYIHNPYLTPIGSPYGSYMTSVQHGDVNNGLSYPQRPLTAMPDPRNTFWFPPHFDPCGGLLGMTTSTYGPSTPGLFRYFASPSQAPLSPMSDPQHLSPLSSSASSLPSPVALVKESACILSNNESRYQVKTEKTKKRVVKKASQRPVKSEVTRALSNHSSPLTIPRTESPVDVKPVLMTTTTSGCQVDMDAEDNDLIGGRTSSLSMCSDASAKLTINEGTPKEPAADPTHESQQTPAALTADLNSVTETESTSNTAAEAPPVLSVKSMPVIQFIDTHGLDSLVDSVENFRPTNEEKSLAKYRLNSNSGNSAYDDGLSLLSVLAEQRSFEETQKANEIEKRRRSADDAERSRTNSVSNVDTKPDLDQLRLMQLCKPLKKRQRSESCQPAIGQSNTETASSAIEKSEEHKESTDSVQPAKKKARKESVTDIDPWAIRRSVRIFIHDSIVQAQDKKCTTPDVKNSPGVSCRSVLKSKSRNRKSSESNSEALSVKNEEHEESESEHDSVEPLNANELCRLSKRDLQNGVRVLVKIDNMLYCGMADPIESGVPDVYGVTLDGDQSKRRQIYKLDSMVKEAIREVKPKSLDQLTEDSRVAAYWASETSCLYTGRVAKKINSAGDKNLVLVEFDDGDKARIAINDVRLLPDSFKHTTVKIPVKKSKPKTVPSKSSLDVTPTKESQSPLASPSSTDTTSPSASCSSLENRQPKENSVAMETAAKSKKKKKRNKQESDTNEGVKEKHHKHHHHHHHGKHKKRKKHKEKRPETSSEGFAIKTGKIISDANCNDTRNAKEMPLERSSRRVDKVTVKITSPNTKDKRLKIADFVLKKEECTKSKGAIASTSTNVLIGTKDNVRAKRKAALNSIKRTSCHMNKTELEDSISGTSESSLSSLSDADENMASSDEEESGLTPRKRERMNSNEKSKIAAFLPERQLWHWSGKCIKKYYGSSRGKKARKEFYRAIMRGKEKILVGDSAVFLSTGRPHLPYVGRIDSMWETSSGNMIVKVRWFYHPEETKSMPPLVDVRGGLFESPAHYDENDVQTISHKCEVLSYAEYQARRKESPSLGSDDAHNVYYYGGVYDPLSGKIDLSEDVPLENREKKVSSNDETKTELKQSEM